MLIEYNEEHSLGFKKIDEQHKAIIDYINKLNECIQKMDVKEIESILPQLGNLAKAHFDTEEKYFHKFNYEHTKKHENEHRLFFKKLVFK